jgi:excisionase family DNA binding protein
MPARTLTSADVEAIADAVAARRTAKADDRPFYSPRSLAARLGVTDRTLRTLTANGTIPSYKIEGSRRYAPADVDAYLARCREERAA